MLYPLWLRNKIWHTVLCVIFILVLSLMPQEKLPKALFSWQDLVVHFIMYGSLAYCISLSLFDKIITTSMSKLWFAPILLGLFGMQIEVLQKILPVNRFFSWEDVACNFLGAYSFYAFAARFKSKYYLN